MAVDRIAANPRSVAVSYAYHQVGWLFVALPLVTSGLALGVRLPVALVQCRLLRLGACGPVL